MIQIRSSVPGYKQRLYLTPASIIIPEFDVFLDRRNNVLAVLEGKLGKQIIPAHNLVSDTGDVHYAQDGAEEAPTNAFGILELATQRETAATPAKGDSRANYDANVIASTQKAFDGSYPRTNDPDGDNTGAGADIVSYLVSYTKGDFNATNIGAGLITNATPATSEPILTGFQFGAAFAKTADDTLKVFVNHTFNGV